MKLRFTILLVVISLITILSGCVGTGYGGDPLMEGDEKASGRVPYFDADGNLSGDADLTFSGDTLTATKFAGDGSALTGISGTGDNLTPEYFVAANDATDQEKAHATAVCDGTADDVQIQAAINSLPSTGGKVSLSSGTFHISTTILVSENGKMLFQGSGRENTILYLDNASNCDVIQPDNISAGWHPWEDTFRDFAIDGNKANQTTGGNGFYGDFYSCKFESLNIRRCWGWGIYLYSTVTAQENRIQNVHFEYNGHTSKDTNHSGGAIRLSPLGTDTWVIDCIDFDSFGNESVYVENSSSSHFVNSTFAGWGHVNYGIYVIGNSFWGLINACRIDGPFEKDGIYLNGTTATIMNWTITNNIVRSCSKATNNTYSGITLLGSGGATIQYCTIANNQYHDGYAGGNLAKYFINCGTNTDYIDVIGNICPSGETATGDVFTTGTHTIKTVSAGVITASNITDSALTSGQIPVAGTGGLLGDGPKWSTAMDNSLAKAYNGPNMPVMEADKAVNVLADTESFDVGNNYVTGNLYGASGAYVQADGSGCNSTTLVKTGAAFDSTILGSATGNWIKWASNATGDADVGEGYAIYSNATTLTLYKSSGADFANSYYFWLRKSYYLAPVAGYYEINISSVLVGGEDAKKYYAQVVTNASTTETLTGAHGSYVSSIRMGGATMLHLGANDKLKFVVGNNATTGTVYPASGNYISIRCIKLD